MGGALGRSGRLCAAELLGSGGNVAAPVCRRRVLTSMGWAVLSVPFYDYWALGTLSQKARRPNPFLNPN